MFSVGSVSIKWNAVLLIVGFLLCRQLLFHIYAKEKRPINEVARLCFYLVIVAVISARLGHVLIFEPRTAVVNFPSLLLPFDLNPDFHLLDRGQFSIHGATFGIILFLWLYKRKDKSATYLDALDRICIAAALSAVFIVMGGFFSSEITGKPTNNATGVTYIKPVLSGLLKVPCCIMRSPDGKNPLENVEVKKDPGSTSRQKSILLYLFFKPGASEQLVKEFLIGDVKAYLYEMQQIVTEPGTEPLHFRIFLEKDGRYVARIQTKAIARYPVQIFEALGCSLIFLFLFAQWKKRRVNSPSGRMFAAFMILFWALQLGLGFLKEKQHPFEIAFDILFILAGFAIIVLLTTRNPLAKKINANQTGNKKTVNQ
jgi:prolipoprotein diacylglyceryltransferase